MSHHITTMLTLFYVVILVLFLRNRLYVSKSVQSFINTIRYEWRPPLPFIILPSRKHLSHTTLYF